jgi:flagellar assembly protein FliH
MVSVTDVDDQSMLTVEGIEKLHKEAGEEGYTEGFEKGQNEGYRVGMETAQLEIQHQVSLLQQVMTGLNTPLADLDEQVEHDLIGLVMTMTRQLVRRELKTDPEHVIGAVRAAMAVLPISDRKVKLFLHPSDVELVKTGLSIESDDTAWKWVEDPLLTRGGVRVETANTTVDATVEARLNSVMNKLLGEERSDDSNA